MDLPATDKIHVQLDMPASSTNLEFFLPNYSNSLAKRFLAGHYLFTVSTSRLDYYHILPSKQLLNLFFICDLEL